MQQTHVRRSEQNVLDDTGQSPLQRNMQSFLLLYPWQPCLASRKLHFPAGRLSDSCR